MPTTDLVRDPFIVYALVELFKDVYPTASDGVKRAATAAAGIIVSALAVWTPGMPWREYLFTTLSQGLAVAAAATLGHVGVKAIAPSAAPSVEKTAEKIARVTKETAKAEITAAKDAAGPTPPAPAPASPAPAPAPPVAAVAGPSTTRVPRERDLPGGPV